MKRTLGLLLALVVILAPSVGRAGGWAVASLDPLPPVVAGEEVSIGFRLLQHGITPVDTDVWSDAQVGLDVRVDGRERFVAADASRAPGHFVATVDVPSGARSLSLNVRMHNGLVVAPEWVEVTVGGGVSSPGPGAGESWLPAWTMPVFAAVALSSAAALIVDLRSIRRRVTHDVTRPGAAA